MSQAVTRDRRQQQRITGKELHEIGEYASIASM